MPTDLETVAVIASHYYCDNSAYVFSLSSQNK